MKRMKNALALVALVVLALVLLAAARGQKAASHIPPLDEVEQAATEQKPAQKAETQQTAPKAAPRNLAIYIFEGVQIIDYTGPFEVLAQARDGHGKLFNVYTVAEKAGPLTTNMGMTVTPKYTFDDMPKTDVLVLPGGRVGPHMENPKVIKWVQDTAAGAEYVMSVCNGAFYLGKAGLLDGKTATTFYGMIDDLRELAPKARVVTDRRFTDNGKILTTAGLSSGIDGALHLVEKIAGRGYAQETALNLEYNWQPDLAYARASFADRHLRKILGSEGFKMPEGVGWQVLGQSGGKDAWEKNWEVRLATTAPELLKIVDSKLAEGWTKLPNSAAAGGGAARSLWNFKDEEGKTWSAVANVQPVGGAAGTFRLSVRLARGDSAAKL